MSVPFAERVTRHPSISAARRLALGGWRQAARTPHCPDTPRLDGARALVTGGSRGIGLATSQGLAERGAQVWMASRDARSGASVARELAQRSAGDAHFLALDLADLDAIAHSLDALAEQLAPGRPLDLFVANAGLWPTRYARSAQGHEVAFATNVLGHQALLQGAIARGLLADNARVIFVTGDIYILASECTPDFRYRTPLGGQLAYCRSKLGNLWQAREWAERRPDLRVHAVHPGVIASELGVSGAAGLKRAIMLPLAAGAQTTLFCATQPELTSGSYYHNVLGRVELDPRDPAANAAGAKALWECLEDLR
ncbi:MAG: SDR family NAD(P)-dependent oxidoreductase [Myxococcota bacterium]